MPWPDRTEGYEPARTTSARGGPNMWAMGFLALIAVGFLVPYLVGAVHLLSRPTRRYR